jgi:uncharacterized membrane-anchored protein
MWLLFAICCAAQLAVPASMIVRHERTLENGRVYRFRCAPVDPEDPFRGRYVALDFEAARFDGERPLDLVPGSEVYALVDEDEEGFARIALLSDAPPSTGDFVKVSVGWRMGSVLRLQFPFDRYYMGEKSAPQAEQVYRSRMMRDEDAWVTVRIKEDHAVLEELYFDGLPVREYLAREVD